MAGEWGLTLRNLFLPTFCKACGRRLLTEENGFFCPTCWEMGPRIVRPFCTKCGRPHTGAVGLGTRSNFPCGLCLSAKPDGPIRRVFGAARYDGVYEQAVKLFKFQARQRLATPLGELMADFARQELDCETYDCLVPVPLHRVRRRERGYNQSQLLAEEILPAFPNAALDESLARIRPTRVQSRLKIEAERRANIRGAFAVLEGARLQGKTVLLVDDVVTSTGTVLECARVLCGAGADVVDVLAVTLAVSPPGFA